MACFGLEDTKRPKNVNDEIGTIQMLHKQMGGWLGKTK